MDKSDIVAGLGEINAVFSVMKLLNPNVPDICQRWAEITQKAIELINDKDQR